MDPESDRSVDRTSAGPEAGGEGPLPDTPLRALLEGLLFASDEPVTVDEVADLLGEERRPEIEATLGLLREEYATGERGLRIQRIAGGYRITTDPRLGPFVRAMVRSRNRRRLSRAALETLALVAYKQPITAPEIQEIRGVNPSAILASLLERRLIRILGRKKVVGKPFLYGTTQEFLLRFGLNALEDLPSMEEFDALLPPDTAGAEESDVASSSGEGEAPGAGIAAGALAEPQGEE
jgi:segregation and condensation protein B